MDLYRIIPKDDRWIISKNIVYIDYLAKIPILVKEGDAIWIYIDRRITKYVLKLVKILQKEEIKFLFRSNRIIFEHKFSQDEIHELNLKQYIRNIADESFFDGFNKIEFDYTRNISEYLLKYKCHDIFKKQYAIQKKRLLSKYWDYYQNKEFYEVSREDIRDYISALEREVKINLLF